MLKDLSSEIGLEVDFQGYLKVKLVFLFRIFSFPTHLLLNKFLLVNDVLYFTSISYMKNFFMNAKRPMLQCFSSMNIFIYRKNKNIFLRPFA